MDRERRVGSFSVAGVAAAGVVVGHWVAYVVAVPQEGPRAVVLDAAGHGYWLGAVKLGALLGLSAVGAAVIRQFVSVARSNRPTVHPYTRLVAHLAILQAVGFTGMEIVERLAGHAPLAGMFGHHIYIVGLAVQFLMASLGALLLVWLGRAAARMAVSFLGRRPRLATPVVRFIDRSPGRRPAYALSGATGVRGPPSL
jgi:hypothetical protein